jgi:hypothetical protein
VKQKALIKCRHISPGAKQEPCMNTWIKKLGYPNNVSFVNSEIDATLTLQDQTTFYVRSYPGELELKLDKEKNSYEAYERVKKMCEGIKSVVAGQ